MEKMTRKEAADKQREKIQSNQRNESLVVDSPENSPSKDVSGTNKNNVDGKGKNRSEGSRRAETAEELKVQLNVLMNSLATLSAEKSRMEANFLADKKQMRTERDECEKQLRELKDKLKRSQNHTHSEVEHIKYRLIMERHEREKEQADNSAMIKELQRLITDERRAKENFEQQVKELKNQSASKTQNKILEAELEMANNKLKQAEAAVKETPPVLLSLQSEISALKKQHRHAIHEERKRVAAAEQQAKALEMAHETRVAGLEARLAELSETVGGYDRLRQQDQHAIQKLKDQLAGLEDSGRKEFGNCETVQDATRLTTKIRELYAQLLDMDNKKSSNSENVQALLKSLNLCDENRDLEYKEKYESLEQEFETYKQQMTLKLESLSASNNQSNPSNRTSLIESHKSKSDTTELNLAKTYSRNLEERIRSLNREAISKEKDLKVKLEQQQAQFQEERVKFERMLAQKDNEYRGKVAALEHQLLRQRERSLALVEEKDQEISTLKASFHTILTKKGAIGSSDVGRKLSVSDQTVEPSADYVTALLSVDSSPMLHYSQELARRDKQVSGLRKKNSELETSVREIHREQLHAAEKHKDEIAALQSKITRLEACKSREGANLEYLKNVFVNFLTNNDSGSKRHMLNAISTVLRFTPDEMEKIQRAK
ncbi:GRIP and coiled-coil domain-containing protein 1 [Venturia canescens]|uniref:GRIP and coiled-coil domain-containing protein 1 n=1 Tax=Venturia canescens TaxID=32260 RepID=UPI001C9C3635|nr:GRIP and coiled-coil domain-containing protein 1 [Venturia canescens]XP_043282141.1 GRIP and coiled-coil domain-containing protein 1 [Venturia canescens]